MFNGNEVFKTSPKHLSKTLRKEENDTLFD